jgi:ATP-dependent DNA helicase RecQ
VEDLFPTSAAQGAAPVPCSDDPLIDVMRRHWGYAHFRPLQREAMTCSLERRDSLVILPTGGGKSLCFQVPALVQSGLAVVVSPLISLMKDQVDALHQCGVAAGRLDSSLTPDERSLVYSQLRAGELKLLYVSPERLTGEWFSNYLSQADVSFIAVDEAHCVSMWGHDFRPEYAQLGALRELFPGVALHAFTATATPHVQADIIERLQLNDPVRLVGSFYRPNLIYKVERRRDRKQQLKEALARHRGESGIIYCISRKNAEAIAADLRAAGHRAAPYHAGLDDATRNRNQDDFINERIDTIVATVAFGMGIDKSNVRYVIHAELPKSLEHYQQESGRAGRDGLAAECLLLYSGRDRETWRMLLENTEQPSRGIALKKLDELYAYATGVACRHRGLLHYFGEKLPRENCAACDVCLGDLAPVENALITAQKILSCIVRMGGRWGGELVAHVLLGSSDPRIAEHGFGQLTTHGLLRGTPQALVLDWIEQLVGQGCLVKREDHGALAVTEHGWRVLRNQAIPQLLEPAPEDAGDAGADEGFTREQLRGNRKARARANTELSAGESELFEALRNVRKGLATANKVPPYIIMSDATLRELARLRPSTQEAMLLISGIGETKLARYGDIFLAALRAFCMSQGLTMDVVDGS